MSAGILPTIAASSDPKSPVPSKHIPTNEDSSSYLPSPEFSPAPVSKLPLVVYYHRGVFILVSPLDGIFLLSGIETAPRRLLSQRGGGFLLGSAHTIMFDAFCYLLKPPTKFWRWLSPSITTTDDWLTNSADYCNYFLTGSNTNINSAYQSLQERE